MRSVSAHLPFAEAPAGCPDGAQAQEKISTRSIRSTTLSSLTDPNSSCNTFVRAENLLGIEEAEQLLLIVLAKRGANAHVANHCLEIWVRNPSGAKTEQFSWNIRSPSLGWVEWSGDEPSERKALEAGELVFDEVCEAITKAGARAAYKGKTASENGERSVNIVLPGKRNRYVIPVSQMFSSPVDWNCRE